MVLKPRLHPSLVFAATVFVAYAPAAFCDIYQWTDEKGGVVYSNIRPRDTSKLRNFKVVIEERAAPANPAPRPDADAAAREAALAAQAEALREQALQQRVANLEQELASLQYASPPQTLDTSAYAYPAYGAVSGYPYSYAYSVPYTVVLPRVVSPGFRPALPRSVPFHPQVGMPAHSHAGGFRSGGGRRR